MVDPGCTPSNFRFEGVKRISLQVQTDMAYGQAEIPKGHPAHYMIKK
jgi:hypothetical protein